MFELVPEEIYLTPVEFSNEYEYAEMKFSHITQSLLKENSKIEDEQDPRKQKVNQIIQYYDSLIQDGWTEFERVLINSYPGEIRRFRRKKS